MNAGDGAAKRLLDAIAGLEAALDARLAAGSGATDAPAPHSELAQLRTENQTLARSLEKAETERDELRSAAEAAGVRIESTIEGIRSLLSHGNGHG